MEGPLQSSEHCYIAAQSPAAPDRVLQEVMPDKWAFRIPANPHGPLEVNQSKAKFQIIKRK